MLFQLGEAALGKFWWLCLQYTPNLSTFQHLCCNLPSQAVIVSWIPAIALYLVTLRLLLYPRVSFSCNWQRHLLTIKFRSSLCRNRQYAISSVHNSLVASPFHLEQNRINYWWQQGHSESGSVVLSGRYCSLSVTRRSVWKCVVAPWLLQGWYYLAFSVSRAMMLGRSKTMLSCPKWQ